MQIRACDATQRIPNTVLDRDRGVSDTSHAHGAQGDLHRDGRPGGPPCGLRYTDDAGRGLRRGAMQVVHEHFGRNGDGVVHEPP